VRKVLGFLGHSQADDGGAGSLLYEFLAKGGLVCYFQPKKSMRSGRVVSAEALVRWDHPTRGLLSPAEFVGLAEQTGLMAPLSSFVLGHALAECRNWHDAGHVIGVAVNLSVSDLLDTTLPDKVAG
jgi:EAL domain-containing protein (putative c-di-GMP-specific phosphodiesterase class I)